MVIMHNYFFLFRQQELDNLYQQFFGVYPSAENKLIKIQNLDDTLEKFKLLLQLVS